MNLDLVTVKINFIEVSSGSFVKYNDPVHRENYLKSKLQLIPDEEWKDQLFAYVGMSKEKLDDLLLELQREKNLLQEEKVKKLGSVGNRCFVAV